MKPIRTCLLICSLVTVSFCAAAPDRRPSMVLSCEGPYLGILITSPRHDVVPSVQLRLTDPKGRKQGLNVNGTKIPDSYYGEIVEVPSAANRSLAYGIEVCGASRGEYHLIIYERGDGLYEVTAQAQKGDSDLYGIVLHHKSSEGRVRHYRLLFKTAKKGASVAWLDANNHEQMRIENGEW